MFNNVPFTKNPDQLHCVHAAMHGVIKHFSGEYYSLNYLNALMNPEHDMWVWPFQAVKALNEAGMFVRLFSQYDSKTFSSIDSLKASFPKHAGLTSIESLQESCNFINDNALHEKRVLSLSEIDKLIHDGCVPIVLLGSKNHLGKYVVLTGYDEKNFYYHESGPEKAEPNKKMSKERFLEKWDRQPSNNMVIVVYGKKFKDDYTRFHF